MNFNSDNIKVFPANRRNDAEDPMARFPTEKNITSLTNLVFKPFIANGLEIKYSNGSHIITAGTCVINGYVFTLLNNTEITDTIKVNNKAYLTINLDSNISPFIELKGDVTANSKSTYQGLTLVIGNNIPTTPYINLGQWNGTKWETDSNNKTKINAEDIFINNNDLLNYLNNIYIIDGGTL